MVISIVYFTWVNREWSISIFRRISAIWKAIKQCCISTQQDTFKIQTQRDFLDVYLTDGSNIRLYIQTSDTAVRILQVMAFWNCVESFHFGEVDKN